MADTSESETDISTFGYRWTTAERTMIFCDTVDNGLENLPLLAPSRRERVRQHVLPSPLESLPVEIVENILEYLDPGSLAVLRSVNVSISESVDSLPAFRELAQYAPQALQALGRTGLIDQYSIAQLHRSLRSDRCVYCNGFGPYLYLLQCARCCYVCMRRNRPLISTSVGTAKHILGLSTSASKSLIKMRTLPGTYDMETKLKCTRRIQLVNFYAAHSLIGSERSRPWPSRFELNYRSGGKHDVVPEHRYQNFATVAFPFVAPRSRSDEDRVQHGVWCRGCEHAALDLYHVEVAYSRLEFLEHCKRCAGIKELKDLNNPHVRRRRPERH